MTGNREGWVALGLVLAVAWGVGACGDDEGGGASGAGDAAPAGASGQNSGGSGGAGAGGVDAGPVNPAAGCPQEGPTREELGDALEPLPAADGIRELVVAPGGLYFGHADGVMRLTDEGRTELVAAADFPATLAVNDDAITWTGVVDGMEGIWTVPLAGGTPTRLYPESTFIENLEVDATHAYFDGTAGDGLQRVPLAGGAAELLARPFGVSDIALHGGFVYYAEQLGTMVLRVPVAGGTEEEVTSDGSFVHNLEVDASGIYTSGSYTISRFEQAGEPATLLRFAPSGMSLDNTARRLILDDQRVLFADRRDNVGWVSKDGRDCAYVIATFAEVGAVYRTDIALDGEYLYLIDLQARELSRIARSAVGL